jgi:hypothetical protein
MGKKRVIKVGSKVSYKGAWGTLPEKEVTVKSIEKCVSKRMKHGKVVDEIDYVKKDYGVYDLSDGHWCYGEQIVELVKE